ncbi:uncharacterized protein LOC131651469 [Vicia villosa]|uniref:uncharacterized protein LOC131651469 n=1 Tax=Vicia villosa TaxID=3911 RepID=UPI00273CBEFC|nr:uncharacterized protein LOC131651469 [Vicia villosa]
METKGRKPFFLNFKKVPTQLKIFCDNISGSLKFSDSLNTLISLVRTNVDEVLLNTMVQFYDPLLHCFTYRDFQLVPSLEEFSYLLGLPVLNKIPYTGKEEEPKLEVIAAALHLPRSEIEKVWISKKEYSGLPLDFLYEKAEILAKASSMDALEAVLSLLIYGQVLFFHYDKIVDVAAINIFLSKNPVPTLLGDLLHSIHFRASKRKGCVLGCASLLHKWFISHLPLSVRKNEEGLTWAQRIMKLSFDDILWYQKKFEGTLLFDSCGDFPNIPLLGVRGGITYNPILARHQFGFALKDKPRSLYLSAKYFHYDSDKEKKRDLFIKAWMKVKKVGAKDIGRRNYMPWDPYFQWVYDRVMEFGMPYPSDTPIVPRVAPPAAPIAFEPYIPAPNEDLVATVNRLKREREDFERRLLKVEAEKEVLVQDAKERETLLDYFSRKWKIEDFVSPDQINSWENEISRLVQEREEMIKAHKEEVRVLKRKRRQEDKNPGI